MSDKRKTVPKTLSLQPEVARELATRAEALRLDESFMVNVELARVFGLTDVTVRLQQRLDDHLRYIRGATSG